jgi:very-short-patch-repair endonuclease
MDDKVAPTRPGVDVAELARRQHGVVAAWQLYSLGFTRERLAGCVTRGWMVRIHKAVYAVGYLPLTRHGRWMAAVLALGEGTVLSHRSAAALWRIWGEGSRALVEVIAPTRAGRARRAGIKVHRPRHIPPEELSEHLGIPTTSPARTLMDLAPSLPSRSLERALDEAARLKLCTMDDLRAVLCLGPRRGVRQLRATLSRHAPGSTFTRSELEERFLALLRRELIPAPLVNHPVLDYEADFLWPAERLIVEVDGHASHGTRLAFQEDRDRDSRLAAQGFRTQRFTWFDVTSRPAVVAHRVKRALGR